MLTVGNMKGNIASQTEFQIIKSLWEIYSISDSSIYNKTRLLPVSRLIIRVIWILSSDSPSVICQEEARALMHLFAMKVLFYKTNKKESMEEVIPITVTVFKTILDSFPVLSAFFFADLFFFKHSKGIYYKKSSNRIYFCKIIQRNLL